MSVNLPAKTAIPEPYEMGTLEASQDHLDEHAKKAVDGQNWSTAFVTKQHFGCHYPSSRVSTTSPFYVEVLRFLIVPRMLSIGLQWRVFCNIAVGQTGNVKVVLTDAAGIGLTSDVIAVTGDASGEFWGVDQVDIARPLQDTYMKVYLKSTAGAQLDLVALACWDKDLDGGSLHLDCFATRTIASTAGLVRYWALQEYQAGNGTAGIETLGSGDDIDFSVGTATLTVDSDLVNDNRIYRRVFAAGNYGNATWTFDKTKDFTIAIDILPNQSTAADHTWWITGDDRLSLGQDSMSNMVQLCINGGVSNPVAPSSETRIFFVTHDASVNITRLYWEDDNGGISHLVSVAASPILNGQVFRLADGYAGDTNMTPGEFLDDGEVSWVAIWEDKALSPIEMNYIRHIVRSRGGLIVRDD